MQSGEARSSAMSGCSHRSGSGRLRGTLATQASTGGGQGRALLEAGGFRPRPHPRLEIGSTVLATKGTQ